MTILDISFYGFIAVVVIQAYFYCFIFGKFAFLKPKKKISKKTSVSVLVCAKNEAKNLKQFLPSIIEQEYPNFEIILINDGSSDQTLTIMEHFSKKHKKIKVVNVSANEKFWGNKKYALTLGIRASSNDLLLFTDADCKPKSKFWISELSSHFENEKTIILGYSPYAKIKNSFLNKLIRFETLITAINYFSFANYGLPYMGVGRNLAYAKKTFYEANGFVKHIKVLSGDDDLFVNQVANKKNTAISFSKNSFTESIPKTSFTAWVKQKRRHVSSAKHYQTKHKILLGLLYLSNMLFWVLALPLLLHWFNGEIVLSLFTFKFVLQYILLKKSSIKLGEADLIILFPVLEIALVVMQLGVFVSNIISKPNHWK